MFSLLTQHAAVVWDREGCIWKDFCKVKRFFSPGPTNERLMSSRVSIIYLFFSSTHIHIWCERTPSHLCDPLPMWFRLILPQESLILWVFSKMWGVDKTHAVMPNTWNTTGMETCLTYSEQNTLTRAICATHKSWVRILITVAYISLLCSTLIRQKWSVAR